MRFPKLYFFKTEHSKKQYIRSNKKLVDSFDVALNDLYSQSNPNLPKIIEGQEIEVQEIPFAYFRYKNQIWPVYADDPGQQNYIYIGNKSYGAGAFTSYPYDVDYFIYEINQQEEK